MQRIKIAVACHKPSQLPSNELFLPIHVGAKLSPLKMDITRDDSGDNISEKNPSYCELTAQYWCWKNLEADYYGLCHYRRYLCFSDPGIKRDLRNQITTSLLTKENLSRFGLDDEKKMRHEIESSDVIIGEEQKVSRLYTPRGNQNTAYEHWVAHDRALIDKDDLDCMLEILTEVSPEIGKATKEYLGGKTFLGFNCFILKKKLFDELCSVEFDTLQRLEDFVDTSKYGQQLSRIYGFMGEIISSGYFYYLEKTGKYKIKRVPLVYFAFSDPIDVRPINKPNVIHAIFNTADTRPELCAVTWRSFLDHVDSAHYYDCFMLLDDVTIGNQMVEMSKTHKNISLRLVNASGFRAFYKELYGLEDDNTKKNAEDISNHFSLLPYFPYIFREHHRAIVIDDNNIFVDSIKELDKQLKEQQTTISAPKDIVTRALINDIYRQTAEIRLSKVLKTPLNYFSTNILLWDFDKARKTKRKEEISNSFLYKDGFIGSRLRSKSEVMNIVYENDVTFLDQKYNVLFESNQLLKDKLSYAPLSDLRELTKARQHPVVITFLPNDPWEIMYSPTYRSYWQIAEKTGLLEIIRYRGTELSIYRSKHDNRSILIKLFPADSTMRGKLTKIFPPNSKRSDVVKKVLSLFHLR